MYIKHVIYTGKISKLIDKLKKVKIIKIFFV